MARIKKPVMQLIATSNLKINRNYSLCVNEVEELRKASHGIFDLISNTFKFGYIQGYKCAVSEIKSKTKLQEVHTHD